MSDKKNIVFINFLRVIAAIFITNSHLELVWPKSVFAMGGLLGDVLFFLVSGFCLTKTNEERERFVHWYGKRIIRIYPPVLIITIVYVLLGYYKVSMSNTFQTFIYPTKYHFIASLLFLYVVFYIVTYTKIFRNNILWVSLGVFVIQLIVYLFFFDFSVYHIDNVESPMIRFIFFQSMLLGTYFKINFEKFKNKRRVSDIVMLFISISLYFATKIIFLKVNSLAPFQIINQMSLIFLLFMIIKCCIANVDFFENINIKFKRVLDVFSKITLEIYIVQHYIIHTFCDLVFPINLFVITIIILATAVILNKVGNKISNFLLYRFNKLIKN